MRVLIIENESYLAQSIASRLISMGYDADIYVDTNTNSAELYDIVLITTSLATFSQLLKKYSKSIVILLNSYINQDTVITPLKNGANDYIVKPFMLEELIRKIEHQIEFLNIKRQKDEYKKYIDFIFHDLEDAQEYSYPLLIKSTFQKLSDFFLSKLMFKYKIEFNIIDLTNCVYEFKNEQNYYLYNFHKLKKQEKKLLLERIKSYNIILSSLDMNEELDNFSKVELSSNDGFELSGTILSIDEYVKYIINNFQSQYPDTELSKRLGISRKSLWEKRKKYGLQKRK